MAVVSISRIQIRRGRKTELPQLASGELGWSIDTQELYIGNGAVAEGAPYVGNTKLLTQHDNLFQFADSYTYRSLDSFIQTGDTINSPVIRTLQDRLDDIVSVRAFGCPGDGSDQTQDLQRALDQLYLNAANKGTEGARVILHLEPGIYRISSSLRIPPYATIRGAGADKTIIDAAVNCSLITVNEESTPGVYADDAISTTNNQARNIEISDLTIRTDYADALVLVSCRDSVFKNLRLISTWTLGMEADLMAGIRLQGLSNAVNSNNNLFSNIKIAGFSEGIYSDYSVRENIIENCEFDNTYYGIYFGKTIIAGQNGPSYNTIDHCTFDNVYEEGLRIDNGNWNSSENNKFYNVGNHGGDYGSAITSIINFNTVTNQSTGDYFKRTEELGYNDAFIINYPFKPEISGTNISKLGYTYQLSIGSLGEFSKLFNLAADVARAYEIDYIAKSTTVDSKRTGKIEVVVDPVRDQVNVSDNFVFSGDDEGYATALKFTAQLFDENSDGTVDTVAIMVYNNVPGDTTEFTYTIKSKS